MPFEIPCYEIPRNKLVDEHKELEARVDALAQKMEAGNAELLRLLDTFKHACQAEVTQTEAELASDVIRWREVAEYRAKENDAMWKLLTWYRAQYPTAVEPK